MVGAVAADVEVSPAAVALVPESDPLAGGDGQRCPAREAVHPTTVRRGPGRVKAKAGSLAAVRAPLAIASLALGLLLASGPRAAEPTLTELTLTWASGLYKGPVVCRLEEGPRRVARTVRISPPKRSGHRPMFVLEVESLDVDGARCSNELGVEEPDVLGRLRIAATGHHRPDIARKDFEHQLRKEGGFRFEVPAGRLRLQSAEGEARDVNFAGGSATLERVAAGSDADRILGRTGGFPKRTLTLEAQDGTRLVFHMVLVGPPR